MIVDTVKQVSHRICVARNMSYEESGRFLNENNIS